MRVVMDHRMATKGVLVGLLATVLVACGGSGSNVGDQSDVPPVASIVAIGLPGGNGAFTARAGSDVLVSAKDSDGIDDPLLEFTFDVTYPGPGSIATFERNSNSLAFTAPSVTSETIVTARVTVEDADGVTATDSIEITVLPVGDTDEFLINPNVNDEHVYLFVSPAPGDTVNAETAYTLTVDAIAHWTDRSGVRQSQQIQSQSFSGIVREGATSLNLTDVVSATQSRHRYKIPLLDPDEINATLIGGARSQRIELEAIPGVPGEIERASITLDVTLDAPGNCNVYLATVGGTGFDLIDASSTQLSETGGTLAGPEISSANATVTIDEELVRRATGLPSDQSADNYYACIDPNDEATTFDDWAAQAGFNGASDVTNAVYVNNYDLGFGRDMYLRRDADGSVYSYVVNYPSLADAIQKRNDFAIVAMEYSAGPSGPCDAPNLDPANPKIVKFYSYVPDTANGGHVRAQTMNFDGRGERQVPGVCTVCHDGNADISSFNAELASIDASNADLHASFMPWDLDSFLYTDAAEASLIDPTLTSDDISDAQVDQFSRESQEDAFKALNEGALVTFADDPARIVEIVDSSNNTESGTRLRRFEEPIRLIHGWYDTGVNQTYARSVDEDVNSLSVTGALASASLSELTSLGANVFAPYTQPGWDGQEDLHDEVFARYCRLCHVQQGTLSKNFDSYDEFVGSPLLDSMVFGEGVMPLSRFTMDRFWVEFAGSQGAGETLRDHINQVVADRTIDSDRFPGRPLAVAEASRTLVGLEPGDTIAGEINPLVISLDASTSVNGSAFQWSVDGDSGCTDPLPTVSGASNAVATFVLVESPCTYTATVEVSSDGFADVAEVEVRSDRRPTARPLSVDLQIFDSITDSFVALPTNVAYLAGDEEASIDIVAGVSTSDDGDGGIEVVVVDSANGAVTIEDGELVVRFDDPLATFSAMGTYRLIDANGSESDEAMFEIDKQALTAFGLTATPSSSPAQVSLEWSLPLGFEPSIEVNRSGTSGRIWQPVSPCTDTADRRVCVVIDAVGLAQGGTYDYEVELASGVSSAQERVSVSINPVPSGFGVVSGTDTSINLRWNDIRNTVPAGSSFDGYEIERIRNSIVEQTIEGIPATAVTLVDEGENASGLLSNTAYDYRLYAIIDGIRTDAAQPSNLPVGWTALATNPSSPSGLAVNSVAGSTTQVRLSWQTNGCAAPNCSFSVIREGFPISSGLTLGSFTDTGRTPDQLLMYIVRAEGLNGDAVAASSSAASGRPNPSYFSNVAPELHGGLGNSLDSDSGTTNCASSGCHSVPIDIDDLNRIVADSPLFGSVLTDLRNTTFATNTPSQCVTDDTNLSDCDAGMVGVTISAELRDLFLRWYGGGALD